MIRITVTILSCFLSILLVAQNPSFVSFELGGSGGIGSVNFEKSFYKKEKVFLDYRFGFSIAPVDKNNGTVLVFPIMIHGVYGENQHKLDLGIGQSISVTTKGSAFVLMPLSIGYRLQPEDKNYYLRLSYTPLVSYLYGTQWQHWAGFTYGIKLNKNK